MSGVGGGGVFDRTPRSAGEECVKVMHRESVKKGET